MDEPGTVKMIQDIKTTEQIEQSLHKKFRKTIWRPFIAGVKKYELIRKNDSIAVCISGGKDSFLLAKLMQELCKYTHTPFTLFFLVMNPGYDDASLARIKANAEHLQVPIKIFETDIFNIVEKTGRSPCYLCARMRRGYLYSEAGKLGCNKIALGHHLSDVVETTLMGMLFGSQYQVMMPKLKSKNFEGLELIRPMYCVVEEDIVKWKNYNNLSFVGCSCPLSAYRNPSDSSEGGSKRLEVKTLLKQLKQQGNKHVETSVFNSLQMLNLDTAIGYKKNGKEYSFLDEYDMS